MLRLAIRSETKIPGRPRCSHKDAHSAIEPTNNSVTPHHSSVGAP